MKFIHSFISFLMPCKGRATEKNNTHTYRHTKFALIAMKCVPFFLFIFVLCLLWILAFFLFFFPSSVCLFLCCWTRQRKSTNKRANEKNTKFIAKDFLVFILRFDSRWSDEATMRKRRDVLNSSITKKRTHSTKKSKKTDSEMRKCTIQMHSECIEEQ